MSRLRPVVDSYGLLSKGTDDRLRHRHHQERFWTYIKPKYERQEQLLKDGGDGDLLEIAQILDALRKLREGITGGGSRGELDAFASAIYLRSAHFGVLANSPESYVPAMHAIMGNKDVALLYMLHLICVARDMPAVFGIAAAARGLDDLVMRVVRGVLHVLSRRSKRPSLYAMMYIDACLY